MTLWASTRRVAWQPSDRVRRTYKWPGTTTACTANAEDFPRSSEACLGNAIDHSPADLRRLLSQTVGAEAAPNTDARLAPAREFISRFHFLGLALTSGRARSRSWQPKPQGRPRCGNGVKQRAVALEVQR